MALLFCDSVRHYTTAARIGEKWTAYSAVAVNATNGRSSGPCLAIGYASGSTNFTNYVYKTLDSGVATLIAGFRFKQTVEFTAAQKMFVAFRDAGTAQFAIGVETSGALQAYKGDFSTTIGSASVNTLSLNTLYYIEVKALIHGSTGTIEVRVNGTSTGWLNLTGADTQASANATANQVIFGSPGSGSSFAAVRYFSDIVICDTSGSVNNDFLGEVNVDSFLPSGAGTYAQLTPSAGSNYACVDETDPNTTDYVSSGTHGHKDAYAFTDMVGNNPVIKAVVNNLWCLKTDSGTVYAKSLAVTGPGDSPPTEYAGANLTPTTTYRCLQHIYEVNPETSAAWSKAEVNIAEFGVQVATS